MRRNLIKILLISVIMVLGLNYNFCMAAEYKVESNERLYATANSSVQYAYSIGSLWKTSQHYNDDFRQNVYNAANKYSQISGISSYYNTEPDYTYMRENNPKGQRRIGSYLVFVNGHANPDYILTASSDTTQNRTGISTGYDSTAWMEDGQFTVAGLQSTNMSGTRLIIFAGCSTGAWPDSSHSSNLPMQAVARGAKAAFGFRNSITSRFGDGPNWLNAFNQALLNGYTIDGANVYACTQYPNSNLSTCSMCEGNYNLKVIPVTSTNSMLKENVSSDYKMLMTPNKDIEIVIDEKNNENEIPLSECKDKYHEIIETIKAQDNEFNINEYKVTSNSVQKESGNSHIYFTKYINNTIKTNKVYFIKTDKNIVRNITIAGIKNENLEKENELNKMVIENKISKFENNKMQAINSKLKLDNVESKKIQAISANSFKFDKNIKDIEEYYYYDYNTENLKYIMEYTEQFKLFTADKTQIELDL